MNKITFVCTYLMLFLATHSTSGQIKSCENLLEKESRDISCLINSFKKNENPLCLIEWHLISNNDTSYYFKLNGRLAFIDLYPYSLHSSSLKSIIYSMNSYQIAVFDSTIADHVLIKQDAKIKIWSSKDGCSHYFVIHASDQLYIWVLSAHKDIYRRVVALSD